MYRELVVLPRSVSSAVRDGSNTTPSGSTIASSASRSPTCVPSSGQGGTQTEFGAKLSLSVIDGFSFVDRLSSDNFNESLDLIDQIERYHQRFGFIRSRCTSTRFIAPGPIERFANRTAFA